MKTISIYNSNGEWVETFTDVIEISETNYVKENLFGAAGPPIKIVWRQPGKTYSGRKIVTFINRIPSDWVVMVSERKE